MKGNAEQTKAKILAAATQEFSAYGFAGARVDNIAANAGCNKQLIYAYFDSKQGLFDAVAETHIQAVLEAVPIDAYHLPEYAAQLFDYNRAHPGLIRLVEWFNLEGINSPRAMALITRSMQEKVAAVRAAQAAGAIHSSLPAEEVLTLVLAISNAWDVGVHNWGGELDQGAARLHRQSIIESVRRLVE